MGIFIKQLTMTKATLVHHCQLLLVGYIADILLINFEVRFLRVRFPQVRFLKTVH